MLIMEIVLEFRKTAFAIFGVDDSSQSQNFCLNLSLLCLSQCLSQMK